MNEGQEFQEIQFEGTNEEKEIQLEKEEVESDGLGEKYLAQSNGNQPYEESKDEQNQERKDFQGEICIICSEPFLEGEDANCCENCDQPYHLQHCYDQDSIQCTFCNETIDLKQRLDQVRNLQISGNQIKFNKESNPEEQHYSELKDDDQLMEYSDQAQVAKRQQSLNDRRIKDEKRKLKKQKQKSFLNFTIFTLFSLIGLYLMYDDELRRQLVNPIEKFQRIVGIAKDVEYVNGQNLTLHKFDKCSFRDLNEDGEPFVSFKYHRQEVVKCLKQLIDYDDSQNQTKSQKHYNFNQTLNNLLEFQKHQSQEKQKIPSSYFTNFIKTAQRIFVRN